MEIYTIWRPLLRNLLPTAWPHDVEKFHDIVTAAEGNGTPYYTNSPICR